jgi:DNA primase
LDHPPVFDTETALARIPDGELERLKSEVSVARLIEASGIALTKRGRDLVGACPFHKDDTPSLTVTPDKNLFHCFGCGIGGGPLDWVMRKNGVSFRHAVELLREGLPGVTDATVKHSTVRALPPPVSLDADDQALLDQVVGYYHQTLKQSPDALAYLEARGLGDPALIDTFKLGYANRTLGLRLPNKQRKDGADIRARLERIGIYRESGHEHFNGSLVMPVLDTEGRATEVYGRKILDNLRAGTPKHLYLPGPHKGVWNLAGIAAGDGEVILCEALIDAATFWCAGYRNVTAAYGVEGFTADHLAAFKAHGISRVVIAFDRDDAGERGTAKIADQLMTAGFDCYRVLFPKGMDANAYGLKLTPASKSLGLLIRKAEWLGKGNPPCVPTTHLHPDASPIPDACPPQAPEPLHPGAVPSVVSADPLPLPLAADPPCEPEASASESLHPGASEALPARVIGDAPELEIAAEANAREVAVMFGDRRYRVRGLSKNTSYEVMRVNVLVSVAGTGAPSAPGGAGVHVDTFDLYAAKSRQLFARAAASELSVEETVVQRDLGRLLLKLEEMQDAAIQAAMRPKAPNAAEIAKADEDAALALLRDPDLVARIVADFDRIGLVGEPTNALAGYLAAVSRKLATPLAIIVQSTSAAGKSALMDAVLNLTPEEDRVHYSAMTGQSLYYLGEKNLKHKILAIAEEEGVRQAAYALKLLQSQGELTIASTGKDPETGQLVTQEYRVEGPVMLFLTTTAIDIDEELMNRCLVLSIDESRAQTRAIQMRQRAKRTLAGLLADTQAEALTALHRNAQRLLKPLAVVNPYADQLTFLDERTRTRRDHQKYLTLIDAIALLHQHQRAVKSLAHRDRTIDYIEVAPSDIALANRLAHDVLGRSLDELPPQTRGLLNEACKLVAERCEAQGMTRSELRFTRRDLRERTGASDTQLKLHLSRLVDLEYLIVHRVERGYAYELIYDGDGGLRPHLSGLIDADRFVYDGERSASNGHRSGSGRASVGPKSGDGRGMQNGENLNNDGPLDGSAVAAAETARLGTAANGASYHRHVSDAPHARASSLAASS